MFTTQKQIRLEFWANHPQFKRKGETRQNQYCADIRVAFCDHVDSLHRSGQITDNMAFKVTL